MFDVLYEMLCGRHDEIPRRRHADPAFDAAQGTFVAGDEPALGDGEWLGRGDVPGLAIADPTEGLTLADEVRALLTDAPSPTTPSSATARPQRVPSSDPFGTRRPSGS